jgi:isoquinoline 1-oxidoreductase beta subunit
VPYLAHAPMEPLNCTVKISAQKCEIWTGTQFQTLDQMVAGKITGLKPEQVEIHTEFLGGGFGRRANPTSDFVAEAVQVAKAAAMPVKTVWSREDDIRGGYYRSMFLHQATYRFGRRWFAIWPGSMCWSGNRSWPVRCWRRPWSRTASTNLGRRRGRQPLH